MACLAYEFKKRQLEFRIKEPLPLCYEGLVVARAFETDFRVEGMVIVEAKALEAVAPVHHRQLQTYLRLSGYPLGLLINFGAINVLDGVVRKVNNFPDGTAPCDAFAQSGKEGSGHAT
jgi:GxxExxY protein